MLIMGVVIMGSLLIILSTSELLQTNDQYPNIAAGDIPKIAQSERAIFSVGSALPET